MIELTRPKSVSVSVSVSERKTSSFSDTVSEDGDVVIIMKPLISGRVRLKLSHNFEPSPTIPDPAFSSGRRWNRVK